MRVPLLRVVPYAIVHVMVTTQQRGRASNLLDSLTLGSPSRLILAVVAVALALSALGLRDAAPHVDASETSAVPLSLRVDQHADDFTSVAALSGHANPATSSHSHCVIHCFLDSLLFPGLLFAAPLLAARLVNPLTLAPQRLTAPPLPPPPQSAR